MPDGSDFKTRIYKPKPYYVLKPFSYAANFVAALLFISLSSAA